MRIARKLFLLAIMALAALAMTASSANAQFEVSEETDGVGHCDPIVVESETDVHGGCHVEFSSEGTGIPLHAYVPAKVTISNCEVNLEAQIDEEGEGYVTAISLTPPHGGAVPCTRAACDTTASEQHLWPFHIREHGPGDEEVEAVFCLRDASTAPGTAGNECEIHLQFSALPGEHQYEIGDGTETFCENNPPNPTTHDDLPAPTSIEAHLISTDDTENVEIVH